MTDAAPLLAALQHAGLPVEIVTVPESENPRTWVFQPALNPGQRLLAILIVSQLLTPPTPPPDLADLERRVKHLEEKETK